MTKKEPLIYLDDHQDGECKFCKDENDDPGVVKLIRDSITFDYTGYAICCLCGQRYKVVKCR